MKTIDLKSASVCNLVVVYRKGKTRPKEGHRTRVCDENFKKSRYAGERASGAREGGKRRSGRGGSSMGRKNVL